MYKIPEWTKEFPSAITICNTEGTIIYMNDKSCNTFAKHGGGDIIGKSVFDCHPEPARTKLKELIETQTSNVYTVEKEGVKKLIYQSPIFENGKYEGFIEISIQIPLEMKNFIRKTN